MDRRTFLKTTGACAATVATTATAATAATSATTSTDKAPLAAPAIVHDVLELRLAMPWPDNLAGPSDQARRLATAIALATSGRIHIEVNTADLEISGSVKTQTTDLYFGPFHTAKNAHKAARYFSGLPHSQGLTATDLEAWLTVSGGGLHWDELCANDAQKPLLAGHLGELPGLWSNTPVHNLSDLSSRTIAVQGASADMMRAIGANPVSVPPEMLATALANGSIDIAECGGLQTAMSLGLHKVAKHVASGVFNPSGTSLALTIKTDLWNDLSEGDRAIIAASASQAYRTTITENRSLQTPLQSALSKRFDIEFHTLTANENKSWERIADTHLAHVSSLDERAKRITASYTAFKNLAL